MHACTAGQRVDFRKGSEEGQKTVRGTVFPTNGLALAVQEMFGLDPFCGAVFVFRSKRADRIKLLMWDQTGMVLAYKRLEGGKFVWPRSPMSLGVASGCAIGPSTAGDGVPLARQDGVMRMSSAQLAALFEGLDWRLVRPVRARRPLAAG